MSTPLPPHLKLLRNLSRALRRPIEGYRSYQDLLRGKHGLEIGGPTKLFRRDLPIYRVVAALDGVNFSASTVWEGQLTEGLTYRFDKGRVGRQFICEATDLSRLGAQAYDFVVSCNNLEHIANPLQAIDQWLRVLKPGGHLLLVLPRKESNFDHRREVTPFSHLLADFANATDEHDLTHLDEILERHDYSMTPDSPDRESLRARGLRNFENRCLHHHVFDLALIEQVFAHFGLRPLLRTTIPSDTIALAVKP
jgi:SAM-dependent methyltransferase